MAKELNIEKLVDFSEETIAEYATTADTYNKYHCIIPARDGDYDIAASLENTLHRILDAGGTGEDIHRIMGAEIPLPDEDTEDYISIDRGYFICGQMILFRALTDINDYKRYIMNWCAKHDIFLEELCSYAELDDPQGCYFRIFEYAAEVKKEKPDTFLEFEEKFKPGRKKELRVETKLGSIRASIIPDKEYPGIELSFEDGNGEPGAIMEYSPTTDSINLRIYSKNEPDGDPIDIYAMS